MIQAPILAKLIRAVGGPMGPMAGPQGPRGGGPSVLTVGEVGPIGPAGRTGMTGPVGLAGLFAELMGPTGYKGPPGSEGWLGLKGPTGTGLLSPSMDYVRYYENTSGYKNFTPYGNYIGCKFLYTIKEPGYTFVFFTGIYTATSYQEFDVGLAVGGYAGSEAAPGPGDRSLGTGGRFTKIIAPTHSKIPFFLMLLETASGYGYGPGVFPVNRWYDLAGSIGTSGFDPPGGIVDTISCCIFEVPT